MSSDLEEFKEEQVKTEHIRLIKRIYKLSDNTNNLMKWFIAFVFMGIIIGFLLAFNLFVILYLKGIIPRWFL